MHSLDTIGMILAKKGYGLYSVSPNVTVFNAVQEMADKDIGALAVIGRDGLLGIFSERDYARKIILLGRSSKETAVGEVLSGTATCITPEDTIDDALRMMTTYHIRHLIVMERDRPVGMISIGDLVNWIISEQEQMIGHLHSYISGDYPG